MISAIDRNVAGVRVRLPLRFVPLSEPEPDSEVLIEPGADPIPRRSAVNLDAVEGVSLGVLVERLGRLADTRMVEVCAALGVAVACAAT